MMRLHSKLIAVSFIALAMGVEHDGKTAQISRNSSAYLSEVLKEAETKKTSIKELRFRILERNRCTYIAVGENGNSITPSGGGQGIVGISFK